MATAVNFPQCDHLRSIITLSVFTSEQTELIHINEQLSSLDRHIAELNTLRRTLHRRTVQLQNQLLPINTFPLEILSYIFQLVVGQKDYRRYWEGCYQGCLGQAFVLSSVSSHFRHVAFGTPELWDRISLQIAEDKTIGNISPLLQHCISCAPNISLCISERRSYDDCTTTNIRSVIETFITLETTRKVKTFHLHGSTHVSMLLSEINTTSFPMIEALTISGGRGTNYLRELDFCEMNKLTRLDIGGDWLDFPLFVPPSLQYLHISTVWQKMFVSLLYQCPNLVECSAEIVTELDGPPFTKPLILKHLKRLRTGAMNALTMSPSLQHLQLPSLESLVLYHSNGRPSLDIVQFCCSVSATLTSLSIHIRSTTLDYEDLHQLCRFSFPKLRNLRFTSLYVKPLMSAIHSLSPLDTESNNPRPLNLPALEFIIFKSPWAEGDPRILLDLLKNWWSDEALHLHVHLKPFVSPCECETDWTPALREELRLIKGSRQMKITWGHNEITESPAPLESQP
ncbi:hypothetical protein AGABI2DRAFT_117463 [Agaricus bisporus var. bisporus H97]|uniref:hypothetical protein n=1 Tax=Agaricus bisporus var. bisporus (strain H97 / ATCC MYA-4626 / FGSC 10389) TaxID=936046 RepID=UPI00029F5B2D|nr:hypothetical protein AGABI2DRAFT_117463 [Agaricus bisporus var. bisporus H97]EKV48658.1 hypothetical protein AGABI2DRAFT_117463 [Agaricus bisporus var. bisporus H97]